MIRNCRDKGATGSCLNGTDFAPEMLAGRLRRAEDGTVHLMLKAMVPPEPALCILQVLEDETPLRMIAVLDRNPVNLYDLLEERGWQAVDGQFTTEGYRIVIEAKSE